MDDIKQAIIDMEEARKSHADWAEYFEQHPEIEAQYMKAGEWDSALIPRKRVEKYNRVLLLLKEKAS